MSRQIFLCVCAFLYVFAHFKVRFGDPREPINPVFSIDTQRYSDVLNPLDPFADDLARRLAYVVALRPRHVITLFYVISYQSLTRERYQLGAAKSKNENHSLIDWVCIRLRLGTERTTRFVTN